MIEDVTEASLLYDFYGQLLTKKKQRVMELYHEEDYTLAETAEELKVSRAAVYDSLISAEKSLLEYEKKLGLVAKFMATEDAIRRADDKLLEMSKAYKDDKGIAEGLREIKSIVDGLRNV